MAGYWPREGKLKNQANIQRHLEGTKLVNKNLYGKEYHFLAGHNRGAFYFDQNIRNFRNGDKWT